ncbi:Ger(x)C family spore germination protein [Jeotgalibacillus sp. S-D1]|uniref:Ger(x)C family spore germination protein n=1 Tax=Jeotgalibacillus sp. S-D1 TaxID=2552189 RepID=UPI00105AA5B0|nr:Ger(x)C family spore germination protein [Jeotgalibacillus sp. S-D1]TDL34819.1 Ger(x)C family spore germination protein [Jeotgalibacillus sp. S-D1]
MKKRFGLILCCSTLLLSSCWDERLLKEIQLVFTVGYDQTENGEVAVTSVVPPVNPDIKDNKNINIYKTGHTLRDARYKADLNVSEHLDYSKLQMMLLGEELAKEDIYSFLDVVYRNAANNLSSRLAVVEGEATELLYHPLRTQFDISQYYANIIESSELVGVLPKISLQTACTLMFDPGGDLYLPYLTYNEEMARAEVSGIALFNGRKYTGTYLTAEQGTLFNVLMDNTEGSVRMTKKYTEDKQPEVANYMTVEIPNADVSIKVKDDALLTTSIKVKLKIVVTEYAPNNIVGKEKIKKIEKWWEEELKKDTLELTQIMQEAKSDGLAIGRRVAAFHPKRWNEKEWKNQFANIPFEVDYDVELTGTGIID